MVSSPSITALVRVHRSRHPSDDLAAQGIDPPQRVRPGDSVHLELLGFLERLHRGLRVLAEGAGPFQIAHGQYENARMAELIQVELQLRHRTAIAADLEDHGVVVVWGWLLCVWFQRWLHRVVHRSLREILRRI